MKIQFLTFPEGHVVSDKEYQRFLKAFAKVGIELSRTEGDIVMVKGFSHTWEQLPKDRPIVYLSIGTEWKNKAHPDINEPIKLLYFSANATIHISDYCRESHHAIFGKPYNSEYVILPADEPKLNSVLYSLHEPLKLATTCIPRPVKRNDQLEELCKKYNIELVSAYGGVSDFSYYHDCDGYIHLSRKEGMPNTVLEALSYGLPCIVTNYGGAKEAVGDAGVVIKTDPEGVPWDPDNINPVDEMLFVDAIEEFKNNFFTLRFKARERVLSELNDYVMACKFKAVFEKLI